MVISLSFSPEFPERPAVTGQLLLRILGPGLCRDRQDLPMSQIQQVAHADKVAFDVVAG